MLEMSDRNYLKGLSQAKSGRKTKRVSVFDQTVRQIKCIENTHDYLEDGNPITEEDLEIGKLYTFIGGSAESYGNMVYLEELPSKYGYQSYLFEEQFEYDEAIILQEQENWLHNELQKGENDIRCGRTYPAEEVFEKLRSEIRLIENEQEKKYMGSRLLYYIKHNHSQGSYK